MDNYKIKVKDEAESKEAQELFFELGYSWHGCGKYYNRIGNYTFITAYPDEMLLRMGWCGDTDKELTLPQLRDLVVLKRNNVKDANFLLREDHYYKSSRGDWYFYGLNGWKHSTLTDIEGIEPVNQPQDPALIIGAEALRALADGKEVEANNSDFGYWIDARNLSVKDFFDDIHIFRLKPQTIKLELELPKPFEPKLGEEVWFISDDHGCGYSRYEHGEHSTYVFGCWSTEEEVKQVVKQVVEQLRKIRGTNS